MSYFSYARRGVSPDSEKVKYFNDMKDIDWANYFVDNEQYLLLLINEEISDLDLDQRKKRIKELSQDQGFVIPARTPEIVEMQMKNDKFLAEVLSLDDDNFALVIGLLDEIKKQAEKKK